MDMFEKWGTRELFVVFVIAGLGIRFFLAPLTTMPYDVSFWAGAINGFNMGEGLYESEYYWYSPTWGYILSFLTPVMNFFDVNVQGFIISGTDGMLTYVLNAVTDPDFNLILKTPLILCDILTAIVIMEIVLKISDDGRKAVMAFGLWMLCPLTVWNSAVQGQFDTLAILGLTLSVLLMIENRYMLAGAAIVFGTITKMFPAAIIPLMVGYVISKHGFNMKAVKGITVAALGGIIMTAALLLPVILSGNLEESFLFLTNRLDGYNEGTTTSGFLIRNWNNIFAILPILIIVAIVLSAIIAVSKKNQDKRFMICAALLLSFMFMWPNIPPFSQYVLYMLPFLIIVCMMGFDLRIPIALTGILFTLSVAFFTGPEVVYPLAHSTGIISMETVAYCMESWGPLLKDMMNYTETIKFIPSMLAFAFIMLDLRKIRKEEHPDGRVA